ATMGLRDVTEAGDGAEAIALFETGAFDLVVTDYNMPRLDGRGLVDFIRHRSARPSVPVIVTTTETDPAKLGAAPKPGASAICDKDVKPEVIREALGRGR